MLVADVDIECNELIVQELLAKASTHPNVTALWLNELFLGGSQVQRQSLGQQMQRALKAIQIMNELPDLSLGQIALIYTFFSI